MLGTVKCVHKDITHFLFVLNTNLFKNCVGFGQILPVLSLFAQFLRNVVKVFVKLRTFFLNEYSPYRLI